MSTPNVTLTKYGREQAQEQADAQGITLEQYLANWLKVPCTVVDMDNEPIATITADMIPAQVPDVEQEEE